MNSASKCENSEFIFLFLCNPYILVATSENIFIGLTLELPHHNTGFTILF